MNNTMAWISLKHIPWSLLWTQWTHKDGGEASADWFIAVRSSSVNNSFEIVSDLFIGSERRTVLISRCSCQFSQIKWIRHFDHWWQEERKLDYNNISASETSEILWIWTSFNDSCKGFPIDNWYYMRPKTVRVYLSFWYSHIFYFRAFSIIFLLDVVHLFTTRLEVMYF